VAAVSTGTAVSSGATWAAACRVTVGEPDAGTAVAVSETWRTCVASGTGVWEVDETGVPAVPATEVAVAAVTEVGTGVAVTPLRPE